MGCMGRWPRGDGNRNWRRRTKNGSLLLDYDANLWGGKSLFQPFQIKGNLMIKKFLKIILKPIWKKLEHRINTIIDVREKIFEARINSELSRMNSELSRMNLRIPQVFVHPNPKLLYNFISIVAPKSVKGKNLIRIGSSNDGGYVMLDHMIENSIVYNFGIGNDISWDMDLVKRGCTIFQYDHTISGPPIIHPNLHFSKIGIANRTSDDGTLKPISDLLKINRHVNNSDLIMNMDIEGCEWDILHSLESEVFNKFSQVLIEFHNLFDIVLMERMEEMISVFKKINESHQAIHVHANNSSRLSVISGIMLPETIEITFVRKKDYCFEDNTNNFPTSLDGPNDPRSPDYFLGMIGKVWSDLHHKD